MIVKFKGLFPWLSIRNKLLIAFAGLSIVPLMLVGIYNILSTERLMRQVALQGLTKDVHTIREKTENFLDDISSDMRVLQNSSSMESWIKRKSSGAGVAPVNDLTRIGSEILSFARTKEIYYQFRLIDETGDELLRVECDNPGDSTKTFSMVPPSELSQGRAPYYFLLVDKLGRNQIAFAPAELAHRGTERIPVVSFALPLLYYGRRVGILVANVFERSLLDVIETKRHANPERKVVLVTGDGHYLYHSEKKRDWNRLLAAREEDNLERDYTPTVATSILSGKEGTLTEGAKEIVSYAPLFETTPIPGSSPKSLTFSVLIIVLVSVPETAVMGPARAYTVTLLGFLVVFLGFAIALGFLATRQFVRPISQLQRGAEIIAEGRYEHRLDVETHDEIERLAGQFNRMAASLEAHDQELRAHRTHLEDMVSQRTKELSEEKTKLQLLLDNVPSAFVLLDRNSSVGAVGSKYTEVDEAAGALWASAFSDGVIGSRTRRIRHPDSGDRLLEYVAVPMKEENESTALLLIITDITERKRLEQQMVQTEKLVAAAEMSSMIASESRNISAVRKRSRLGCPWIPSVIWSASSLSC
jgi:HAMP domain-containing protein